MPDSEVQSAANIVFALATPADAPVVVDIRIGASRDLTEKHGRGHWSNEPTERGIVADLRQSKVMIARHGTDAVATFRLSTRKPWAIDRSYFTDCKRPIYLTSMAVRPDLQHRGVGRQCVDQALRMVRAWPADALRLDAYDAEAGAGGFYTKCSFREVGRTSYRSVPLIYYELLV
jgi:GNAT superfamily N-acetyltransferase